MTDEEIRKALRLHKKITGEEAPKATPPPEPAKKKVPSFKLKFGPPAVDEGDTIAVLTDSEGKAEISLSFAQWLIFCTNIARKLPYASGHEEGKEEVEIFATFENLTPLQQMKGLMDLKKAQMAHKVVEEYLHPPACEPGCSGDSRSVQHKFMAYITDCLKQDIASGEAFEAKGGVNLLILLAAYIADLDTHKWDSPKLLGADDPVLKCIAFFLASNTRLLSGKTRQKVLLILRDQIADIFGEDLTAEDDDDDEEELDFTSQEEDDD